MIRVVWETKAYPINILDGRVGILFQNLPNRLSFRSIYVSLGIISYGPSNTITLPRTPDSGLTFFAIGNVTP
jgi:hypothetical protein